VDNPFQFLNPMDLVQVIIFHMRSNQSSQKTGLKIDYARLFTPKVFAGAIGVALFLLIVTFVWIELSAPPASNPAGMLAVVTTIALPPATSAPAATPTFDPYAPTPTPTAMPGQIDIGAYVQITGTQGQGLRIRSDPGLNSKQLFLGFDTEAYTVIEGPRDADGYTWYRITAINDQTREGWAASNFLTLIPKP